MAVVWFLTLAVAAGVARRFDLISILIALLVARGALRRPHAGSLALVVLACACAGWGWWTAIRFAADRAAVSRVATSAGAARIPLGGIVASFPRTGLHGTTFDFVTRVEGRRVRLQMRAERFDVAYGDRCRVRARFVRLSPGTETFLSSRGLAGAVRVRAADMEVVGAGGNPIARTVVWPLHRFARTRLARATGSNCGLAIGLLLGEREQLTAPLRDAVRRLGIAHLLAISGMHLTTIAGCVIFLSRWRPRRRSLILLLTLSLYAAVVGNVESLTRAYLMALILIAAHAMVRPLRPMDALARTLFIMVVAAPLELRSVGLQLSFAATFAVLMCLPLLSRSLPPAPNFVSRWRHRAWSSLRSAFVLSLAVEVFIAPLQLHHFGAISVLGPVATPLFFVPVTWVLLGAGPVTGLAAAFPAAEWPGRVLEFVSALTTRALLSGGSIAPALLVLPEPNPWIYYGGLWIGCRYRRHPLGLLVAACVMGGAFLAR